MKVDRPSLEELTPRGPLRDAFDDKSAAFEAGRLIKSLRTAAGLTQVALAERLHVSQARVSAIENGDGPDGPTYGMLRRIVVACGYRWSPNFADSGPVEDRSLPLRIEKRDETPHRIAQEAWEA